MGIIDIIILLLVGSVVYCYGIYPYLIQFFARIFKRTWLQDTSYCPTVSIVAAAHNEEDVLERFLDSLLTLDYPAEKCEIIIASDGSDDQTNAILAKYASIHDRIKPYYYKEQRGKMPTINDAVINAKGEILFFADADLTFSPNTLRAHVQHFTDPQIGVVAGAYKILTNSSGKLGDIEGDYASLEQRIRASESQFASTMNVYGGNYSIRRELWKPLPSSLVHDDMFIVFSVLRQGKRVISEPATIAYDRFARSFKDEFSRKIRSASRGYHTLSYFPEVVFFQRIPESFLLWSHKILRWLSPIFIAIAGMLLAGRYLQTGGVVYGISVLFLLFSLLIGIMTYSLEFRGKSLPIFGRMGWFVAMNGAYIIGTWRFLTGRDSAVWKKASRDSSANFL